jgi:hypothetical protein
VGELHRDTIDLNSATSRKRFVIETLRKAAPGNGKGKTREKELSVVREQLDRQLMEYARVPPGPPEPTPAAAAAQAAEDPRVAELAKTPPDLLAEAEALLCDPNLLKRASADIEALGLVGEENNRKLMYLVGTSAQLARPLAVITRGASSSGKSFVTEQVSRLFPPEVVLNATSLTTNALDYFSPGRSGTGG